MQKVVDAENKGNLETGGSTSIFWLSLLGFIAVYRRSSLKRFAQKR
jgi:hypothetical protein